MDIRGATTPRSVGVPVNLVSKPRGFYRFFLVWVIPYGMTFVPRTFGRLSKRTPSTRSTRDKASTRKPTIVIPNYTHWYVKNLRRSIHGGAYVLPFRQPREFAPRLDLRYVDIFHLHFVDAFGRDRSQTAQLITELKAAKTRIVWTAHDLTPHTKQQHHFDPIFQLWAEAADGVIHHSHSGERRMRERYQFRPSTLHTVIENRCRQEYSDFALLKKRSVFEAELGLTPTSIPIGLLGSPRVERKVLEFLEGVAMSSVQDLQVVCWSLRPDEVAPRDERIKIAEPWRYVTDRTHAKRLAVCDLVALPFDPDGEMLTTGVVSDAVAMGIGILASEWEFVTETAGAAAIPCGHLARDIATCLDSLKVEDVIKAREASVALREGLSWESARAPLLAFYQSVLDAKGQGTP